MKRIILVTILIISLVTLVGCSSSNEEVKPEFESIATFADNEEFARKDIIETGSLSTVEFSNDDYEFAKLGYNDTVNFLEDIKGVNYIEEVIFDGCLNNADRFTNGDDLTAYLIGSASACYDHNVWKLDENGKAMDHETMLKSYIDDFRNYSGLND